MQERGEIPIVLQPRRGHWPRIVVVGTLVLLVSALVLMHIRLKRQIAAELGLISKAGLPVQAGDLNAWDHPIGSRENAAVSITEAAALIAPTRRASKEFDLPRADSSFSFKTNELKRLEILVATNAQALSFIQSAASLYKSRYPIDWRPGPGTLLPHLAGVARLSTVIHAQALVAAEHGDATTGAGAVKEMFWVARSLDSEPCLVSQFVRARIINSALLAFEHVLNKSQLTEEELLSLDRVLGEAELQNPKSMKRALIGERSIGLYAFDMPPAQLDAILDVPERSMSFYSALGPVGRNQDMLFYLRGFREWLRLADLPIGEALEKSRSLHRKLSSELQRRKTCILSSKLLPDTNWIEKLASLQGRLGTACAAVAVERYHLQHSGVPPASLGELIPKFLSRAPVDPFTVKMVIYSRLSKGYQITISTKELDEIRGMLNSPKASVQREEFFKVVR